MTEWAAESAARQDGQKGKQYVFKINTIDNGQVCFPDALNFEDMRQKINAELNRQIASLESPPARGFIITGVDMQLSLYRAFAQIYPCTGSR